MSPDELAPTGNRCQSGQVTPVAPVAQLQGTQDDLIPPGDGIGLVAGRSFTYLEVPQSSHTSVVEVGGDTLWPRCAPRGCWSADQDWVVCGHGAAFSEDWWDHVAGFIVTGQRPIPDAAQLRDSQYWLVKAGAAIASLIWLMIATVLVLGVWLIVRSRMRE